jgi:16S rRNA processing protein RimM
MPQDVLMAAVIGAHGLKGEVRVKCFARSPASLSAYGPLHDEKGRPFTLAVMREGVRGEWIVRFAEIGDRAAAEALKGVKLYVPRDVLPATTADEYYHTDLIGLAAVDGEGRCIGKVTAVYNFGAGDILAIAREGGEELLLAFTRENVPRIEVGLGRLTVVVPNEVEAEKRP